MMNIFSFYFKARKYGKKTVIVFKIIKPQGIGVFNEILTLKIFTVDKIHMAHRTDLRWEF